MVAIIVILLYEWPTGQYSAHRLARDILTCSKRLLDLLVLTGREIVASTGCLMKVIYDEL